MDCIPVASWKSSDKAKTLHKKLWLCWRKIGVVQMRLFYELHGKRVYSLIIKKKLGEEVFLQEMWEKIKRRCGTRTSEDFALGYSIWFVGRDISRLSLHNHGKTFRHISVNCCCCQGKQLSLSFVAVPDGMVSLSTTNNNQKKGLSGKKSSWLLKSSLFLSQVPIPFSAIIHLCAIAEQTGL